MVMAAVAVNFSAPPYCSGSRGIRPAIAAVLRRAPPYYSGSRGVRPAIAVVMMGLALNGGAPPPRPPLPLGGAHTAVEALRASALYCVGIGLK